MKRIKGTSAGALAPTRLSIAVGYALCAGMAAAQDEGPARVDDEIMVTGSRITRDGMSTPTPVTAITAEDMQMMAPGQFIDSLDYLPPFFMNDAPDTAASKSQSAGAANVNLRGLGANRTLVLLDGRRMVPSNRLGDDNSVDSRYYTDVGFTWGPERAGSSWELFLNVQNLLDRDPPPAASFAQFSGTRITNDRLFDFYGRRYVIGIDLVF